MFKKNKSDYIQALDAEIDKIILDMQNMHYDEPAYTRALEKIGAMQNLKKTDNNQSKEISPDVALGVAGNLAGILLILNFEKLNVISSKALGFVLKTKL